MKLIFFLHFSHVMDLVKKLLVHFQIFLNLKSQVQETQEKMTAMQNEYRKQIDNLEVNLSTTNGTLLRRDNEIKMLREGVSYIS